MEDIKKYTLEEAHKEFAKQSNGQVWGLLGKAERTQSENEEMELAAFASLYHWKVVGTEVHHQRGEWMIAHVYTVLGNVDAAIKHANRCLELTEQFKHKMADFDIAYAYEGIARANALAGDGKTAKKYLKMAVAAGEVIADPESKGIFTVDLDSGEWYGVR